MRRRAQVAIASSSRAECLVEALPKPSRLHPDPKNVENQCSLAGTSKSLRKLVRIKGR